MSLITIDSTLKFDKLKITSTSTGRLEFKEQIFINSPTLEIVRAPQKSKYNSDYSFGVKFYESSKNKERVKEQKELFKSLIKSCKDSALEEIMKNEKCTGKKISSSDEVETSRFFYDNDVFYINFNPRTVDKFKYNKKTKQQEILTDNIIGMLGTGSVINMFMSPSCYYGKKSERLTPISLTATKIVIRKSKNNSSDSGYQKHGILEKYGFGKFLDYTLSEDIVKNEDVPIHTCSEFDVTKYRLSNVRENDGKKYIYGNYGPSGGRTYFRADDVVVMYDIKESPEYGNRTVVTKNQDILNMVSAMDKVLLAKVKSSEQDIFGREKDIDSIRENNYTNPLKDSENPRAVLKLQSIQLDDGNYKLAKVFIMGEDNVIAPFELKNSYERLEEYISSGTQLASIIFSIRPVIVNKNIYLTMNTEQILINPKLEKVNIPRFSGFMFKNSSLLSDIEYDIGDIPEIEYSEYNDTFEFGDYDTKKGFESFVDDKKMFLLSDTSSIYDVCLEHNPDEYKTFGKVKCHLSEENKKTFESITNKVIEYTVKNSKTILGQKKKESVIRDMFDESPPLIKYGKNDVDKKNPFFNLQVSCYKREDEPYSLDFTAFKLVNNTIQKLEINEPEDLLQVFTAGTRFVPFIKMKGMCVNKTVYLKMYVVGGLVLPAYETVDNKFDDDISDSEAEDEEVPVLEDKEQGDSDAYESEEESDDE